MTDPTRRPCPGRGLGIAILAFTIPILAVIPVVRAGGRLEVIVNNNTAIKPLAWDNLAIPIAWVMNDQGALDNCNNGNPTCIGGTSPITLQRGIDAIRVGFDSWEAVPSSTLAFTFDGTVPETAIGLDGINLVTWADNSSCGSGTVAVTPNTSLIVDFLVTSGNRDLNGDGIIDLDPAIYPDGTLLLAGTMLDADLAWCPTNNDYTDELIDTTTFTFDIVGVGTHEIGHFFGASHSSLIAPVATMLPFVDTRSEFNETIRSLSQDDMAAVSRIYPAPSFGTEFGTITGQLLFPGSTDPATGVSVTAFNKATGEMTVQVFSVSQFTATADDPGSFRIGGLPAGSYRIGIEYFDSATGPGGFGDADWWDNNRYNTTIFNGNVSAGQFPLIARPEFFTSPESSSDDLEVAIIIDVAAGQTVGAGDGIINIDLPPAPPGTIPLDLGNGEAVELLFPEGLTFPFFGENWTSVFANDNGNLTFGAASTAASTDNFLGPDISTGGPVPPRIGLPMTNLDPSVDNQGQSGKELDVFAGVFSDALGDRVEVIYLGTPAIGTNKSATVIARLYATGRIEIDYRFFSPWWGIVGVSPGGSGTAPFSEIDITAQLPFSTSMGEAVFEHFRFDQPFNVGGAFDLVDAFDLNGTVLIFEPNGAGGYDITSPDFFNGPPRVIENVRFESTDDLAWDARPEAQSYAVYSGLTADLIDTDGDGVAEGYGACLTSGLTDPDLTVATPPAIGTVAFHLATARNTEGESPLRAASNGLARPSPPPCP